MTPDVAGNYLACHMAAILALAEGVSEDDARWRPSERDWSLLEVINHLLDEERLDFRVRLDYVLHRPGEPWPKIDPPGWVAERAYNERDLRESSDLLASEREASLQLVRGLSVAELAVEVDAPWGGVLRGGDMLSAWVAHDVLHMRQLVELRYALVARDSAPFTPEYAGDW